MESEVDEKIKVYAPLRWERTRWISEMIHAQKTGLDARLLEALAEMLVSRRERIWRATWVIPAPAKSTGSPDHAYRWAEALAKSCGGRVFPCLKREGFGNQRDRSVQERRAVRMSCLKAIPEGQVKKIVFADDVVTSGSTAIAAYIALGRPKQFEVWAIGCRPKGLLL